MLDDCSSHVILLIVHATIRKGIPGNSGVERGSFMNSSSYNIGGYYFSLLDVSQLILYLLLSLTFSSFIQIENGLLRNASTQVSFAGPLLPVHSFTGMSYLPLIILYHHSES